MTYRDDLAALEARHGALEHEVAQKTEELTRAARLLDEARTRTRLPVLPNIRIASPCTADWAAMTGDERVRACADCSKRVYNLSEMTRDEAEALILEKEGKLCVRYFQRKDGTILLKDCAIGVSRGRRRKLVAAGAVAMFAAGGAVGYRAAHDRVQPEVGAVGFSDPPARTEYRVVQVVEAPPDELEVVHKSTEQNQEQEWAVMGDMAVEPSEPDPGPGEE